MDFLKTYMGILAIKFSVMNQALSSGKVVAPLALMKQGCLDDITGM